MRYKTEILANIDAAKAALDAGYRDLCDEQVKLALVWLDKAKEFERVDQTMAEILSIFDHPMYHKKEAE